MVSSRRKHGSQFLNHSKTFEKKAASNPQASEFFPLLCGQVLQYSTVRKDCFSQLKETAQFSYMAWRE